MARAVGRWRRRVSLTEAITAICVAAFLALRALNASLPWMILAGLGAFIFGVAVVFKWARIGIRKVIWRLRNRLIVAYLFIAVVPITLVLVLAAIASWLVIGQMAVYLVNTELQHRVVALMRPAQALARIPISNPDDALQRFSMMTKEAFPDAELLITGQRHIRYPAESRLAHPVKWGQVSGLVLRREGNTDRLYAWAHFIDNGDEVTVTAPVTYEVLSNLVPGLGEVAFVPLMSHRRGARIPEARNPFDFALTGFYPVDVPQWDAPQGQAHREQLLTVSTRASAVLGTVFQKAESAEGWMAAFVVITVLFLLVEMASLLAGVQLSRSITGAVHELYRGTRHIKEGDFSYRIPVKGSDQLAELATSFNSMTANLGRLIVVAKEKERLESELEIAREVQRQLFPKDVPSTRTLQINGVCNPARMVSGDYYDFVSLSDDELAFAIGDVAGKGISAALLMAAIQSTMRTQLSALIPAGSKRLSTAELVANLNRQLFNTTAPEKYATFYFAVYHVPSHSLTYTNAGHLSPLLVRGSQITELEPTGTVVGIFADSQYEERTLALEVGDLLVAYTDGVVEPENAYGEMFGEERLKDIVFKYAGADSSEVIARTMEDVVQWTGSSELQDDMTMVLARRV